MPKRTSATRMARRASGGFRESAILIFFHALGRPPSQTRSPLAFVGGLDAAGFKGSEQRELALRPGTTKERRIGSQVY